MKATKYIQTLILTAIFCLMSGVIFADGTEVRPTANCNDALSVALTNLTPSLPAEATFDDDVTLTDLGYLAPNTPIEATFDDVPEAGNEMILQNLAPVTPSEADFDDIEINHSIDISTLAPVSPGTADFEEVL